MTYLTEFDTLTFPTPLGTSDFDFAREFSQQQKDPDKARRVYLNTLAVRAVNFYCHDLLKIETELEKSKSWDKNARFLMDVADLKIKGLGTLECRPVLKGEKVCYIPPEVRMDRIGYVIVEIDEKAKYGTLINFVKTLGEKEELLLADLPDIEGLIDLLWYEKLRQQLENLFLTSTPTSISTSTSKDWSSKEETLASRGRKAQTVRGIEDSSLFPSISKAKLLKLKDKEVALIVEVTLIADEQLKFHVEVVPTGESNLLPLGLQLSLLDEESAHVLKQKKVEKPQNRIDLKFRLEPTDAFSIMVALENVGETIKFPCFAN